MIEKIDVGNQCQRGSYGNQWPIYTPTENVLATPAPLPEAHPHSIQCNLAVHVYT